LANKAGIQVPEWRIETVARQQILLSRRFDRKKNIRIPFLSAMSVLGAKDNEMHSYLEIADAIRQMSASPKEDLKALWRRIVFNVLISNVDDHLRNHAFLYSGLSGWRLSPTYDLNPTPTDIRPRILSTAIDLIDPSASLDVAAVWHIILISTIYKQKRFSKKWAQQHLYGVKRPLSLR
jgi:serine/threonine-protein kinase HipA